MRRKFFESYARAKGFNPLIAANWYVQPRAQIIGFKVFFFFLFILWVPNNVIRAIITLFATTITSTNKLSSTSFRILRGTNHRLDVVSSYFILFYLFILLKLIRLASWHTPELRRKFFEKYARTYGFDSQNPSAWYQQPREQIMAFKVLFLLPFLSIGILIFCK